VTYLNPVRLHFAGQFQADPSTVNNDVRHFDTPEFQKGWQQLGDNSGPNGWWNPDGSGSWRLVGINVTSVAVPPPPPGSPTNPRPDAAIGLQVASSGSRVAGKIVDLDPYQQGCSQIWGLNVRLTNGATDFFSGPFAVAAFADLWNRAQSSGGDMRMGAFWQSVIGPVTIDNSINSPVLHQLAAASPTGMLSIKFNVDGFNNNTGSTGFTLGRCVGTIGPALADEPQQFVLGRQLFPDLASNSLAPLQPLYFMQAVVDETTSTIYADFGNALPTITPGSDLFGIGKLEIGWLDASSNFNSLGTLDESVYTAAGWYEQTAGIVEFPLSSTDLANTKTNLLAIQVTTTAKGKTTSAVWLRENQDGLHCRADNFVHRLNPPFGNTPGDTAQVTVWASQYGKPLANAPISVSFDPSQLSGGAPYPNDPLTKNITAPPVATPTNAIWVGSTQPTDATDPWPNATITTGTSGNVTLTINCADPGNARPFVNSSVPNSSIDGQVYGVRCMNGPVATAVGNPPNVFFDQNPPPTTFGFNPSDVISLLVWSGYPMPSSGVTPQWSDVAPILAQYAVLYPVMDQLIDLTNQQEVNAQAQLLYLAFSLPITDPNSMPVTRDLSAAKRATLLAYLAAQTSISPTVTGAAPQGKPVVIQRKRAAAPPPAPSGPSATELDSEIITPRDSKTIAMRNRLSTRKK
jgi:hypothetical protein